MKRKTDQWPARIITIPKLDYISEFLLASFPNAAFDMESPLGKGYFVQTRRMILQPGRLNREKI